MEISGSIVLSERSPNGSRIILSENNMIVYRCGDALAKMAAGVLGFSIKYIFFQFRNGAISPSEPLIDDTITGFKTLTAPDDFIRVPIVASPAISVLPSEANYFNGNRVTWFASTAMGSGVGEVNGLSLTDGVSKIHTMGLIASDGSKDSEVLFAKKLVTNGPVTKTASYDLDIHWTLRFGPVPV